MQRARSWQHCLLAPFVALAVLVAPLYLVPSAGTAFAQDARSQARDHYNKGNQLFAKGDFQGAIAEFAEADRLAPSPMLEYNIALCYDRLGDGAEALRRYRIYLKELPSASNKSSVEAKIARLEGQLRAEAEAKRKALEADAAKRKSDQAKAAEAAEAAKAEEEARRAEEAKRAEQTPPADVVPDTPAGPPGDQPRDVYDPSDNGAGAQPEPRGPSRGNQPRDPELQRVAAINVAAIRDRQLGGNQLGGNQGGAVAPQTSDSGQEPMAKQSQPIADQPKAETPIYKKWWFWGIVIIGTLIAIDFATSGSDDSEPVNRGLLFDPQNNSAPSAQQGGLEWRF